MEPYYADELVSLHHGDCLDVLRTLPDASVDAVVTDPPYGLEFMGKAWDRFDEDSRARAGMSRTGYTDGSERLERPSFLGGLNPKCRNCERWQRGGNPCACDAPDFPNERRARSAAFGDWCVEWTAECLRVLKPGGHLLAFGGTRTWHRLACAVEDAGFEVRDSMAWLYGSGFPKSMDVSKAIDSHLISGKSNSRSRRQTEMDGEGAEYEITARNNGIMGEARTYTRREYAPGTPDAEHWQGWGTALKPAFEPIVVARKPLAGTVAANVLAHGTGALNIDACRIEAHDDQLAAKYASVQNAGPRANEVYGTDNRDRRGAAPHDGGRWPANVVLDENQAAELDEQAGVLKSGAWTGKRNGSKFGDQYGTFVGDQSRETPRDASEGGASRFFYVAKADQTERVRVDGVAHPTVKPLALMRWLVRLVTPPSGLILEPFAGSGTTVEACILEGFRCIAIEREETYLPLIRQRISRRLDPVAAVRGAGGDGGLFDLLDEADRPGGAA